MPILVPQQGNSAICFSLFKIYVHQCNFKQESMLAEQNVRSRMRVPRGETSGRLEGDLQLFIDV